MFANLKIDHKNWDKVHEIVNTLMHFREKFMNLKKNNGLKKASIWKKIRENIPFPYFYVSRGPRCPRIFDCGRWRGFNQANFYLRWHCVGFNVQRPLPGCVHRTFSWLIWSHIHRTFRRRIVPSSWTVLQKWT